MQQALGKEDVFVELHNHLRPDDAWLLEARAALTKRHRARTVATNHVRYHHRSRRLLHDVLTAIRHRATLEDVRGRLPPNSKQALKSPEEMAKLFRGHEDAVGATLELAQACNVDLDFRHIRFPGYPCA